MDDKDIVRALGRVEASVNALSTQQELTRVSVEAQGQRIASLPCLHHGKKISDLYKRVGAEEENTSRFMIEREVKQDQRKFLKWAKGVAVALTAAALPFIIGWAAGGN